MQKFDLETIVLTESTENSGKGWRDPARITLILAAVIALASGGYALFGRNSASSPATEAGSERPDVGASITALEAKLKQTPNDGAGWARLGWALFETSKFAESARAYGRATQLEPGKAENWSAYGEALVRSGRGDVPPDAQAAFRKASAIDPKDPRARYFLAAALDIAGNHKGAIDGWIALLEDTPSGAPWETDVRTLIGEAAKAGHIDVTARLAAIRPPPAPPRSTGAAVATAAIPGPTPQQMRDAAGMPKGQQDMMIQGMVDGLERKLKASPDNPQGWIMLMRSRLQLGETAKASAAFKAAQAALATDQQKRGMVEAAAEELGVH